MLRIVMGIIVVLIAFSRNYLGVHTPQDTVVGVAAGLLVMWLTVKLMAGVRDHPEKDIQVMGAGIAISVAVAVFAALKSDPVDYDAAGNILVDGAKMANDTFKGWIPGAAGTVITCFIEMFYVLFIFPYCIKKLETVPLTDPDL